MAFMRACADIEQAKPVFPKLLLTGFRKPAFPFLFSLGLLYLHVLDHSAIGAPVVPAAIKTTLRRAFNGPFIAAGGFDAASAQQLLAAGDADLVAFGRPFLANPDLVARRQFLCGVNIPAGKGKDLEGFSLSGPSEVVNVNTLNSGFKEDVLINRVEYSDGSIWQRKAWNLAEVKSTYERVLREPWVPGMCKGL